MKFAAYLAIFSVVLFSALEVEADTEDDVKMARPTLGQTGKLFTVSFTPGNKQIKVQLTGKTVATADPERITLFGKSYPRKGKPQDLKFLWNGSHYQIQNEIDSTDQIEIQIHDKPTQKTEVFRLK